MTEVIDMTELMYISAPEETEADASICAVESEGGQWDLVLDRTPFYPQGGGQPSDVGTLEGDGFTFAVQKAVLIDGVVHHHGVAVDGTPGVGAVHARIDPQRRAAHAELHSGGHLIMTAMHELTGMRAVKGFHFPDGPYVEFDGVIPEEEKERLLVALQARIAEMVAADEAVLVESTTVAELEAAGVHMPAALPADKPTRVVTMFGYRSPCGGTHVASTGELVGLSVRRIKAKSGRTRVAYELAA
jgi:Ser-tRNA(Ala) deacylase AlaX